jgi:multiple sugar transport system permease protein
MEDNKNVVPNSVPTSTGYSALTNANNSLASQLKNDAKKYDVKKVERRAKIQKIIVSVVIYFFLILLAVLVLFPFYWMINSSLKSIDEYRQSTPTFWPNEVHFENYVQAFQKANLGQLFLNTVYVGLISTLLSLVITVLSAFAFARLEFKGRDSMFAFLLATMMIPGELFTITNYSTVKTIGWMNTFTALIVPFLVSVFYIYLLRQNFKQIPNELYLAAKVDGKSDMEYLLKVMVPLAMPSLVSITILKMMGAWNSYIWPRLVTTTDAYKLVTNGLRTAFNDEASGRINYPLQMAAVVIVSLPLFIIFVIFRKYIMRGVSRSGTKG